jgi:molecular chaperone DnaK (HSP70)
MRLGVDFGTTRIVVAAADRGNYPLVSFETSDGGIREWFPPVVALHGEDRLFGWDTWQVQSDAEWTAIRSLKRRLKDAGPHTQLDLGGHPLSVRQLLIELLQALKTELYSHSTLDLEAGEPLEVMLGIPANANTNQRFLTADAFRAAGFQVLGMLNEPSAASIEFGHRNRSGKKSQSPSALLVYDLGGGTFDASLVEMDEYANSVIATTGIANLGGDDFDQLLAELALEAPSIRSKEPLELTSSEWFLLLEECREKKESLNPNTRKIVVDLDRVRAGWGEVTIPVAAYYERCRPLVEQTRTVVEEVLDAHPKYSIETLYVTGGGSELPPVSRILKETFGRRVRRSAYMRSATAIGLAIAADAHSGYSLHDRLNQNFGVWREADQGRQVTFDLLLPGGIDLPDPGQAPFRIVRSYQPVHNIGYFRYVECSRLGTDLQPLGDITAWDEIRFPFDPVLKDSSDLSSEPITAGRQSTGDWVEEEYSCDSSGQIKVTIANRSAGYGREYRLGRWSDPASTEPQSKVEV